MFERNYKKFLYLNALTSAQCMVAQMCLNFALSYIFSNSIFVFSFFTGLYLMMMGMGVLLVEKFPLSQKRWTQVLVINGMIGVMFANPGVVGLLFCNEYFLYVLRKFDHNWTFLLLPLGILLTMGIGIVSGAELPIFSKIYEEEKKEISKPLIGVLWSDYFGAFLGIIIFIVILYPFIGLINVIFFSQIIVLIYINVLIFSLKIFNVKSRGYIILICINFYVLVSFVFRDGLINYLNSLSGLF